MYICLRHTQSHLDGADWVSKCDYYVVALSS